MNSKQAQEYYQYRRSEFLVLFAEHSDGWKPFLIDRYGEGVAHTIVKEAREQVEILIPEIPYIGGDDNPMTRHLIRSTTSLALYKVMKARGKTARETGRIIYDAVVKAVNKLPFSPAGQPSPEFIEEKKAQARESQKRRYPGNWVWEFVEGNGEEFDYGYDFYECGVQKYYHVQGADELLPYFCFLDFATIRTSGQILLRTTTLAEGGEKCDFRFKSADGSERWPPPFPT